MVHFVTHFYMDTGNCKLTNLTISEEKMHGINSYDFTNYNYRQYLWATSKNNPPDSTGTKAVSNVRATHTSHHNLPLLHKPLTTKIASCGRMACHGETKNKPTPNQDCWK